MLGADLARFASEGLLAVLLLTGSAPLWIVMVLAAVLGAGQAFFNPAMTGLMPEMVSAERLQSANALRGVASSTGQVLGPGLAGIIVAAAGAGWAIAIDSATYAVSAACLLRLTIPPRPPARQSSMLAQLAGGWHEFRSRTWLWAIVAQFATFNALCFAPFMVLGAVTAHDRLGGAGAWGGILAALGAGSILGGFLSVRLRGRRPLVTATLGAAIFAVPLALIALPTATILIAIAIAAAGAGLSIFSTLWETTLQRQVPREVLSRVSAYDWFGSVAFVPLGYLIAVPLAALLCTRATLFFAAVWAAGSCAIVLTIPGIRNLHTALPSAAPAQHRHEPPRAPGYPAPPGGRSTRSGPPSRGAVCTTRTDGTGPPSDPGLARNFSSRQIRVSVGHAPCHAGRQRWRCGHFFSRPRRVPWRSSAPPRHTLGLPACSGLGDQAELAERGDAVVKADLLGDEAVLDLQDSGAGEPHHLAGVSRQRTDGHVVERVPGVGAAALPLADHVVALGDEIGGAPEVQVGERGAELSGELADRVPAAQRRVQRVLEPDVRGGEFVDDGRVEVLAPELAEPPAHNRLVLLD